MDGPLTLGVNLDSLAGPSALRNGKARFRLEKRRLDGARGKRRLDDMGRGLERGIHITAREGGDGLKQIRSGVKGVSRVHLRRAWFQRLDGVGHRLEDLVLHPHTGCGLPRVKLGIGDHHGEKVGHTAGHFPFGNEHGQVGAVQAGGAGSRHVCRGEHPHDPRHRLRRVCVNLQHPGARVLGEHDRAMQHPRHAHVIDERLVAQRLLQPALPRDRITNTAPRPVALGKGRVAAQAELFTEEEVAARLIRQAPAAAGRLPGRLNRIDDASVAGAAAQMAVERLGDRTAVAAFTMLDQRRSPNDDPRYTETALHPAFEDERFPDDAARLFRHAFERDNVVPLHLFRLPQARQRRPAVDHHEAAAAGPLGSASVLGADNAALLAQHLEQVHAGLVRGFRGCSVESELNCGHAG